MIYVAIVIAVIGLALTIKRWPIPAEERLLRRLGWLGLGVAPILAIAATVTIVPPGEVAVPVLSGSAQAPLEEGFHLRNPFAATPELQASIEAKLQAEQDAQRAQFRQDQARIDAQTVVISATAEAEANRLVAESLTPDLLQLRIVEALGDNAIVYLLGSDGPTPVIPLPTP